MNSKDLSEKRKFIAAYFDDFFSKIERVERILSLGMREEAVTLACCYVEALANLRYEKPSDKSKRFIEFLKDYSGSWDILSKISIPYLLSSKTSNKVHQYHKIVDVLDKQFESANLPNEITKEELIEILDAEIAGLDKMNLRCNLDKFSYAAFLYDQYRSRGVHFGGVPEVNRVPYGWEDRFWDWPYFDVNSVINFLKSGCANLATECEQQAKWPYQLEQYQQEP